MPLVGIDMVSNMVEVGVRLGVRMFLPEVLLRLLIVALGRSALAPSVWQRWMLMGCLF